MMKHDYWVNVKGVAVDHMLKTPGNTGSGEDHGWLNFL